MSETTISTGVSNAPLQKALDAFRAEVGADHVLTREDALEFRDPYWYRGGPEFDASAIRLLRQDRHLPGTDRRRFLFRSRERP